MAATFDELMGRTPAANRTAREKREEVVQEIIRDVEQTSLALRLGNVTRMNAFQQRLRVTATVPSAYFINGTTTAGDAPHGSSNTDDTNQFAKDSGLKQTANATWDNLYITPDEIAVLVPMPDAWRDDSDLAWEEIRSMVRTAFAQAIDKAIFFGESTTTHPIPSTFGDGLVTDALLRGATLVEGIGADLADDYARLYETLSQRGFVDNNTVVDAAEVWRLIRLRSAVENLPIYTSLDSAGNGLIYGRSLTEQRNGTWLPTRATAITGDWSHLRIGVRQEIQFRMFDSGVIHDAAGNVVYNAMQQDGEILRACMRLGYVVVDPYKYQTGRREFPFQVLLPQGYTT